MIEDFTARRRAAIQARHALLVQLEAEWECICLHSLVEQDWQNWLERERVKREEYARIMEQKRDREKSET
jgi:hypothetical protein